MNRRHLLGIAAGLGLAAFAGCAAPGAAPSTPAPSDRLPPTAGVPSSLGRLTTALLDLHPTGNVVLSPLSIATALGMARNGARGRTASEFETVLGTTTAALNAELNALDQALDAVTARGKATTTSANSAWAAEGVAWREEFLAALAGYYGVTPGTVDFAGDPAGSVQRINAWISDTTRGLIPRLLSDSDVSALTRLVLVNALYLNALWAMPFDPNDTTESTFFPSAGAPVRCHRMTAERDLAYLAGEGWTGVVLPYNEPDLAMALVLPSDAIAKVPGLDGAFGRLLEAPPAKVALGMPRWNLDATLQLKADLMALGLVSAFGGEADFSGATAEPLSIGAVVHRAVVKVGELGTEAAAATGVVEVGAAPVQQEPIRFELDRTFYFAVCHVPTRTPVFVGRVDDPTKTA